MKYRKLTENAGKPQGFWGSMMIHLMNKGHFNVTGWGLEHIDFKLDDYVLDVGCGGGRTVDRIAEKLGNGKVFGIDYSDLCVKKSSELNKRNIMCGKVKILKASVQSLPFEDGTFDKVIAVETYYFWQDKLGGLKEIRRVMKSGGELLLVFEMLRNGDDPDRWKAVEQRLGIKAVAPEDIRLALESAGFVGVETFVRKESLWLCAKGIKEHG